MAKKTEYHGISIAERMRMAFTDYLYEVNRVYSERWQKLLLAECEAICEWHFLLFLEKLKNHWDGVEISIILKDFDDKE